MKIGILGYGLVGEVIASVFNEDIKIVDPKKRFGSMTSDLNDRDIIFVCLPTPMGGTYQFVEAVKELMYLDNDPIIVIKSTITPETISKIWSPKLILNPEYMRDTTAFEDYINPDFILLGGNAEYTSIISQLYKDSIVNTDVPIYEVDIITASLAKYMENVFLATKVALFNQFKEIHAASMQIEGTSSWELLTQIVGSDKRIGISHTQVPGHDGKPGFGGACLPKDIKAYADYAKELNVEVPIIESVIKTNNKIRKQYPKDDREKAQFVTYDR